jgi:hypothetical protein
MKILVLGNGFDLAHDLPTGFQHVMAVLRSIAALPYVKLTTPFDDLFAGLAELDADFLARSRALYSLDELTFAEAVIRELKDRVSLNTWYAYFDHQHDAIHTWIDFERKIGAALDAFVAVFAMINAYTARTHALSSLRIDATTPEFAALIADQQMLDVLVAFDFLSIEYHPDYGSGGQKIRGINFNTQHFKAYKQTFRLDDVGLLAVLNSALIDFAQILDSYLTEIVGRFSPQKDLLFLDKEFLGVTDIYSFNYTSTFLNFYQRNPRNKPHLINIDYLHGQAGNGYKKIVLGVQQVSDTLLAQYKAYGFLKYHQKLFNNTDYHFLSENRALHKLVSGNHNATKIKLAEILIWGHSLDPSDHEYIGEIFAFNPGRDEGVRVKVLFHTEAGHFAMLSNLLHILGKDTVEYWMKKNWLRFEPVPDIYALNCPPSPVAMELSI